MRFYEVITFYYFVTNWDISVNCNLIHSNHVFFYFHLIQRERRRRQLGFGYGYGHVYPFYVPFFQPSLNDDFTPETYIHDHTRSSIPRPVTSLQRRTTSRSSASLCHSPMCFPPRIRGQPSNAKSHSKYPWAKSSGPTKGHWIWQKRLRTLALGKSDCKWW